MEEIARLNVFSDCLQARNESKNETSTIYRNKGKYFYPLNICIQKDSLSRKDKNVYIFYLFIYPIIIGTSKEL